MTQNKWQRQLAVLIMCWQSLKVIGSLGGKHPEFLASSNYSKWKATRVCQGFPRVECPGTSDLGKTPRTPVFGQQHQLRSWQEITHSLNLPQRSCLLAANIMCKLRDFPWAEVCCFPPLLIAWPDPWGWARNISWACIVYKSTHSGRDRPYSWFLTYRDGRTQIISCLFSHSNNSIHTCWEIHQLAAEVCWSLPFSSNHSL